jgi:DNA sulfur modification protein DndE
MRFLFLLLALILVIPAVSPAEGADPQSPHQWMCDHCKAGPNCKLTEEAATELVAEAFLYAFPLVLMDATRAKQTNVAYATPPPYLLAPINQLALAKRFPDASYMDVVAVNTDTLGGRAYMDLTEEPMILHVPAMDDSPTGAGKRYFVIPVYDPWTNVYFNIGSRTTGSEARDFAFVGPHWHGRLPKGVTRIDSPYPHTFMLPRIYCTGGADVAKVHALQDKFDLRPLSAYGLPSYTPPPAEVDPDIDMYTPPSIKIMTMNAVTYFERFIELLQTTPPPVADLEMIKKLRRAGFLRGRHTAIDALDPVVTSVLDQGITVAKNRMLQTIQEAYAMDWIFSFDSAAHGTDYLFRAVNNYVGYGSTLSDDIFYLNKIADSAGSPLINHKNYKLHFEPGQMPPVSANAFWSLTIYNRNAFFVDEKNLPDPSATTNYAVHKADVLESHYNEDGSLDIYITTYANKAANVPEGALWLPSPTPGNERFQPLGSQGLPQSPNTAPFSICLRLFWPEPQALEGLWQPPKVLTY